MQRVSRLAAGKGLHPSSEPKALRLQGWRKGDYHHEEKDFYRADFFIVILVIVLAAGITGYKKKTGSVTGSPAGTTATPAVFRFTGYSLLCSFVVDRNYLSGNHIR